MDAWPLNQRDPTVGDPPHAKDPLRLCVNTTVALLACLLGPIALLGFSVMAIVAYARARRAGVLRSRCILGSTRNVLVYLSAVAVIAAAAIPFWIVLLVRIVG